MKFDKEGASRTDLHHVKNLVRRATLVSRCLVALATRSRICKSPWHWPTHDTSSRGNLTASAKRGKRQVVDSPAWAVRVADP